MNENMQDKLVTLVLEGRKETARSTDLFANLVCKCSQKHNQEHTDANDQPKWF